ncbi:MAG: glycosyltransferase [Ktedonobacterales bacterium]|nr:glycosyltransferase [Ktedonobacterales bacterium]
MRATDLSLILPVHNEEENIPLVHQQIKQALDALGQTYEIIYVDDGSTDASYQRLAELVAEDPTVAVIRFRRNYGQTAAISAGLDYSRGDIIVLMDADLQNDPADISHLLEKLDEGYDVVSGWRNKRRDTYLTRKLPSLLANKLISRVTGVRLHDYGCTLKAYRREVLEPVRLYGEMHRFLPVYAFWSGARITEIRVNHRARRYGKSKYGLSRTLRVVMDLVTVKFLGSYSTKPLYMFGRAGLLLCLASFLSVGAAVVQSLLPPYVKIHNNPLASLGAVLIVLAMQFIMLGLLAEIQMRTYYESQGKPTYTLRSVVIGTANGPVTLPRRQRRRSALRDDADQPADLPADFPMTLDSVNHVRPGLE